MLVAALTGHRGKGYLVFEGGSEYVILVGAVAVGLSATGPGEYSVDSQVGIDLAGSWWPLITVVGGLLAGGALLTTLLSPSAGELPGWYEQRA